MHCRRRARPSFLVLVVLLTVAAPLVLRLPSIEAAEELPLAPPPPPAGEVVEALPERLIAPAVRDLTLVSSPGLARAAWESAAPLGVLAGRELVLERRGTLGDTLAQEPGVASSSFGPGASRPVLRGLGGNRVRILEGGVGTLDVSNLSDDHAVPQDPFAVVGYEVFRGPASLRFGPEAVGGAVFVRDGRVPELALNRSLSGRVGGALGSADAECAAFANLEGQSQAWRWRASGFARATEDLDIPGFAKSQRQLDAEGNPAGVGEAFGTLPNSNSESVAGSFGLSRLLAGGGFAGAALSVFSSDYGLPNEPDVHIEMERVRLDVRGRHQTAWRAARTLEWSLGFVDYEHTEFEGSALGTVFDQQAVEGRLEITRQTGGRSEGSVGVQASYTDLQVVGAEAILPEARTVDIGLFALERRRLSSVWTLEGSARYDLRSIESTGDEAFHALSVSAGLIARLGRNTSLTLAGALTQRAPTAFELYADGPHVATEQFEIGDASLDLEQALSADLTLRSDGRLLTASGSVFYVRYPEFIGLLPTGAVDVPSGLDIYLYQPLEAQSYGFELDAALHLWRRGTRGLDLTVKGDAVYAEDLTHDTPLALQPPLRLGGGLLYQDPRFVARVELLHAFAQDHEAPFELATDAYTSLEAALTWRPHAERPGWSFTLVGTNLLDEAIRLSTSYIKDLAPLAGASIRFEASIDF